MTFETSAPEENASPIEYAPTNTPAIDGVLIRLAYAQNFPDGHPAKAPSVRGLCKELNDRLGEILEEAIRSNERMHRDQIGGVSFDVAIVVNKTFETAASPLDAIPHVLNFRDAVAASRREVEVEKEQVKTSFRGVMTSIDSDQIKRMTRSTMRDTGPRGKIAVDPF